MDRFVRPGDWIVLSLHESKKEPLYLCSDGVFSHDVMFLPYFHVTKKSCHEKVTRCVFELISEAPAECVQFGDVVALRHVDSGLYLEVRKIGSQGYFLK
jgi:hypothetical protein